MDLGTPSREPIMIDEGEVVENNRRLNSSRCLALSLIPILLIIGLGVGLGIGLRQKPGTESCFSTFQRVKNEFEVKEEQIKSCPNPSTLSCPTGKSHPPLIVVSLDGFRAEYLLRNMTPNLDRMSKCGIHAPYMRATFPTKTFPNHYTIATGLYTESHGIIDNLFHDLHLNRTFSLATPEVFNKMWYRGEPIWNTAKKAGKNVLTMMWPGSAVDVQGMRPTACYNYDKNLGFRGRVEEVLTYFDPGQEHPDLVFIYLEQPDSAGHDGGPYSDMVQGNLTVVDNLVGRLVNGIMDRGYKDCINFIVVADHGMDQAGCGSAVNISEYLDMNKYFVYRGFHSRVTSKYLLDSHKKIFYPNPSPVPLSETVTRLSCTWYNSTKDWYVRAHAKEDLPKRYHYSNDINIDDIVLDIQPGFVVQAFRDSRCIMKPGGHGSDNTYSSMHAIFLGMGSSFESDVLEPFENIELYNLFADLAGVNPAPNNGTYGRLHFVIKGSEKETIRVDPRTVNYLTCSAPDFKTQRMQIRRSSGFPDLNSSCFAGMDEEGLDKKLILTQSEVLESLSLHLPLEFPGTENAASTCKLIQKDFITAFNSKFHMPLWSSFTLRHEKSSNSNVLNQDWLSDKNKTKCCLRADVRIKDMIDYSKFNNEKLGIQKAFLFPPGFSKDSQDISDSHISSNIVPMYKDFETGVWKEMIRLIEEYSEKYSRLNVLLGPVFDHNFDGLADSWEDLRMFVDESKTVAVPSHYFVVLISCGSDKINDKCLESFRTISFVLPHKSSTGNCWDKRVDNYLRENVARIRDVELLSGLSLLSAIRDKETKIRLLTFLEEEIWPRWTWFDVVEPDACPKFPVNSQSDKGPVLLVSLDGFRPDYLNRGLTPTLSRLYKCGVTHSSMTSVYPSMTFPNHFSISTGMYPESHGIVDNKMFSNLLNESFFIDAPTALNPHWWNAEPVWSRVIANNKTAMVLYWPGSDVEILGKRPTDYENYSDVAPSRFRVNKVLDWLDGKSSEGRVPDLVCVYFVAVDNAGHEGGPDSIQVNESLVEADKFMSDLMDGLFRRNLHNRTNLLVVSDHGMARIYSEKEVKFKEYLSDDVLDRIYIYETASPRISTKYSGELRSMKIVDEDKRVPVEEIVSSLTCKPNMKVYLKEDCPKRFHYSNNDRIDEILLFLNEPWVGTRNLDWSKTKGYHGWDPLYDSMKALFIGWGPIFKEKTHFNESFENIELYNLLTYLLEIAPAPNNGTWGSLHHLLRIPPNNFTAPPSLKYPNYQEINESCPFPSDGDLIVASNHSLYECPSITYDYQRLNMTSKQRRSLEKEHVAHGTPTVHFHNLADICTLHQANFVSAYHKELKLPLWSAFNLTSPQTLNSNPTWYIPDVRVPPNKQHNCRTIESLKKNFTFVPLVHLDVKTSDTNDTHLLTNIVPMYNTFAEEVWTVVLNKLFKKFFSAHFILGPIFDKNSDGLADSSWTPEEPHIPTHYFVIVLKNNTNNPIYETASFVFPNIMMDPADRCEKIEEYMGTYKVRIRDVELLTGLRFLTAEEDWDSVRSRTFTSTETFFDE